MAERAVKAQIQLFGR